MLAYMRRVKWESTLHAAAIGRMLFGDKSQHHKGGLTGEAAQKIEADAMLQRVGITF